MKLRYMAVIALKAALKASRQLTFAEQAEANEMLDEVRRCALRHYGASAAVRLPEESDSKIERLLKHHGLYEVCTYAADNFPGEKPEALPEGFQDLVMGLAREAAHGYALSTHHEAHRLTAPASMQPALKPPKALPKDVEDAYRDVRAMLDNAIARIEALETQMEALALGYDARIAALESAVTSEGPLTNAADGAAQKEGA